MDNINKNEITREITRIGNENKIFLIQMFIISMKIYIRCLMTFGRNDITKEVIKIYKEIIEIVNEETQIHSYIKKNAAKMEIISVQDYLIELNELNNKTLDYYVIVLNDIIVACDLKNEIYAKRIRKDFETLNETDAYKQKAVCLSLTMKDLKQILGYEEKFWEFIEERIVFAHKSEKIKFGVDIQQNENGKMDVEFTIPTITDYESKIICEEILSKAYQTFKMLDKSKQLHKNTQQQQKGYILKRFN